MPSDKILENHTFVIGFPKMPLRKHIVNDYFNGLAWARTSFHFFLLERKLILGIFGTTHV